MSAPEASPDLSVVSDEPSPRSRPEAAPVPRSSEPTPAKRSGAPWWLVVVVAVVGVLLFLNQWQRAEGLDARVRSLTEELTAADQQLEIANQHVAAHQAHLQRVRAGVAALSDQVAGLQALADRDPLAPAPAANAEEGRAPAADSGQSSAGPAPAGRERAGDQGALTDAQGYYWRAEGVAAPAQPTSPPPPAADAERRAIIEGATGTSFATP